MGMTGEKRLAFTLLVTLAIMTGELVGGYLSNSLALLSDAGHMVTDALAIMLGLVATIISRRPSDSRATFGHDRVGLLAALINGLSLLIIALVIFYEAYERFLVPPTVDIRIMLAIASVGLAGNLLMVFIVGHSHADITLKSVWLHILGDTLSSVGVIISGIIIYYTQWAYADPITSILIGGVIIWGGIRLVRDTISIFLNLTPRGFDVERIAADIAHMHDVIDVHDVHLWPVAHNQVSFSAHILVDDKTLTEAEETKKNIEALLKEAGVHHSTLQIECSCIDCDNSLFCAIKPDSSDHEADHHH
jgi:cobalt-zinc-cadmium efflux system protein